MFAIVKGLWAQITRFADRASQTILGWFGKDRRSTALAAEQQNVATARQEKVAAEQEIMVKARLELAFIRNTGYATTAQAAIALQGYRRLYQQITLPEVRQELQLPSELCVLRVGENWRIMDVATARKVKPAHHPSRAQRRHKHRANALRARAAQ